MGNDWDKGPDEEDPVQVVTPAPRLRDVIAYGVGPANVTDPGTGPGVIMRSKTWPVLMSAQDSVARRPKDTPQE